MGSTGDISVKDTVNAFGVYCKEFPFAYNLKAKELYKNSWHDTNGDDEYVPSTLKMESYELTATFVMKDASLTIRSNFKAFLNYIVSGELKVYDKYTNIGKQNVRFVSVEDDIRYEKYKEIPQLYSSSKTYVIGDVCQNNGNLYSCKTSISTPEQFNFSHWNILIREYGLLSDIVNHSIIEFKVRFKVNDPITDIVLT